MLVSRQKSITLSQGISIDERTSIDGFPAFGLQFQNLQPSVTGTYQQSALIPLNSARNNSTRRQTSSVQSSDLPHKTPQGRLVASLQHRRCPRPRLHRANVTIDFMPRLRPVKLSGFARNLRGERDKRRILRLKHGSACREMLDHF